MSFVWWKLLLVMAIVGILDSLLLAAGSNADGRWLAGKQAKSSP